MKTNKVEIFKVCIFIYYRAFIYKFYNIKNNKGIIINIGKCQCGANIYCLIDNSDSKLTTVSCTFSNKGDPSISCGKRQIRGQKRKNLAREIAEGSVDVYLADQRRMYQ